MNVPEPFRADVAKLPPALRALLEAELAAGNEIADIGHSFPAPPIGAFIRLERLITTLSPDNAAARGLRYRRRKSSLYSSEYTDATGHFFILEPARPEDAAYPEHAVYPDTDAIRAAANRPPPSTFNRDGAEPDRSDRAARFERSMAIDYDKWREGIGYDLNALKSAYPSERERIEALLVGRAERDWRDVEALAALDTPRAREALKNALHSTNAEIRLAVTRYAPDLVSPAARTASLIDALQHATLRDGLSQAIDEAEEFHPPEIIDTLLRATLERDGEAAVHFSALLFFLHGKAPEPFDMAQRPFFLRFHTTTRAARETIFAELCATIGVDPAKYLKPSAP